MRTWRRRRRSGQLTYGARGPLPEIDQDTDNVGSSRARPSPSSEGALVSVGCVNRRERLELVATLVLVAIAATCHFALGHVATFVVSAVALAALARLVGGATEQL